MKAWLNSDASRIDGESGQNTWFALLQNVRSRSRSFAARGGGASLFGTLNTRTNPFSVSGHVAQPLSW
jgi:hypothetical protein